MRQVNSANLLDFSTEFSETEIHTWQQSGISIVYFLIIISNIFDFTLHDKSTFQQYEREKKWEKRTNFCFFYWSSFSQRLSNFFYNHNILRYKSHNFSCLFTHFWSFIFIYICLLINCCKQIAEKVTLVVVDIHDNKSWNNYNNKSDSYSKKISV